MPFKHNDKHRHKFPKAKYRVTNWSEYNEALRQRGDVTVWVGEDLLTKWHAPSPMLRGGPPSARPKTGPITLIVDRTGLNVSGEAGWM